MIKSGQILAECVGSAEPLSEDKVEFIFKYNHETNYIDYKLKFNTGEQREWLKIAKDIVAFANTSGGYIVFGVEDNTFKIKGVEVEKMEALIDPDKIQQKVNACFSPPITHVTSKVFTYKEKKLIIVHVPESYGKTHIAVREGKCKSSSGEHIIIRKGEIYIRRSGSSILIEPNDLDNIINKRVAYYKETLLKNVTKVVEAPVENEVLIFDPNSYEIKSGTKKFILSSDSDAIPVKGISTTTIPDNDTSEIVTSIALFSKNRNHLPDIKFLYRIYKNRELIKLSENHIQSLALICIYEQVPCFYWLQFISKDNIRALLNEIFKKGTHFAKYDALRMAACLSKTDFEKYYKKENDDRHKWLKVKLEQLGTDGMFFQYSYVDAEKEATNLADHLSQEETSSMVRDKDELASLDYILYSKNIAKKSNDY